MEVQAAYCSPEIQATENRTVGKCGGRTCKGKIKLHGRAVQLQKTNITRANLSKKVLCEWRASCIKQWPRMKSKFVMANLWQIPLRTLVVKGAYTRYFSVTLSHCIASGAVGNTRKHALNIVIILLVRSLARNEAVQNQGRVKHVKYMLRQLTFVANW